MKNKFKNSVLRLVTVILAIILMMGIMAGCGESADKSADTSSPSTDTIKDSATQPSDVQSAIYPLTVSDAAGTKLTIEKKPTKIVILPLGTCEMMMSLVDKSTIVAMTYYVDDKNVSNIAEQAKGVGQRLDSNAEKIIALQPDLVITDSWSQPDFIKQLRDAGLKVYIHNVPSNVDQQKELITQLGKIVNEDDKATELISWMDAKLKAVADKLSSLKENDKLAVLEYSEMVSTSGKGTNFDDVVTRAGLINPVSKDGLEGWPQLSKEMVIKYNPDILILPGWYYDSKNSFESLAKSITGDKSLAGVKAVKEKRLLTVPYKHISTTSQYSVLAVEDMAKVAYPELFK